MILWLCVWTCITIFCWRHQTARSWPARLHTMVHTSSIQAQLNYANDCDVQLDDFKPEASTLITEIPLFMQKCCI